MRKYQKRLTTVYSYKKTTLTYKTSQLPTTCESNKNQLFKRRFDRQWKKIHQHAVKMVKNFYWISRTQNIRGPDFAVMTLWPQQAVKWSSRCKTWRVKHNACHTDSMSAESSNLVDWISFTQSIPSRQNRTRTVQFSVYTVCKTIAVISVGTVKL